MGSEASKTIDPPDDWEPKGAGKSFEIISPVSDISNPSDIRRFHPKPNRTRLVQGGGVPGRRDRPLPSSRRVSKTVTTSLPLQSVSRNSRGSSYDVPPPSAFYFPTKDSERYAEQRMKSTDEVGAANQNKENDAHITGANDKNKKMSIRLNIFKVMTACLDDQKSRDIQLEEPPHVQSKVEFRDETIHYTSEPRRRLSNAVSLRRNSQHADGNDQYDAAAASSRDNRLQMEVPLRKLQKDAGKPISSEAKTTNDSLEVISKATIVASAAARTQTMGDMANVDHENDYLEGIDSMASLALHQEDAYFDRLSLSSNHETSPFVAPHRTNRIVPSVLQRKILLGSARHPAVEPSIEEKSTLSSKSELALRSMPESLDSPLDYEKVNKKPATQSSIPEAENPHAETPVNDMISASTSLLDGTRHADSPVSSLLRFYTTTGPMESSPTCTYRSDQEHSAPFLSFVDEIDAARSHKSNGVLVLEDTEGGSMKRESQESHSSLYTTDSKTYGKFDGKKLQLLVPENSVSEEVSELPSCFRTEKRPDVAFAALPAMKATVTRKTINQVAALAPARPNRRGDEAPNKISKLESLFRPVLPALSSDDAQSITSYDPYEIKVTESAPGLLQTENFVTRALRKPSPQNTVNRMNQIALFSPSMVSIDTQREESPSLAKVLVSHQAECNSEFLFANDYGPLKMANGPDRARDSSTFSISTAGARSRLTQRSITQTKGFVIPIKIMDATEYSTRRSSSDSYKSERRVRFSTETVKLAEDRDSTSSNALRAEFGGLELHVIENSASDLTDSVKDHHSRDSGIMSARSSASNLESLVETSIQREGSINKEGGDDTGATPDVEGMSQLRATNSHYIHIQEDNDQFGNLAPTSKTSFSESIDLPAIERNVSDLTEAASVRRRQSSETCRTFQSLTVHETIPEEDEKADLSPETSIHWTYSENGVTPYVKGNPLDNATKSPFIRFKNAKNRFSMDSGKELPTKSPKKSTKVIKKGSGGIVSARIEELNFRVSEIRKMKRMQKKTTNPRLHTHNFDNKQPVRNRALLNYKTNIKSADIGKSNTVMAAKFNVIPDVDDDDNSSFLNSGSNSKSSPTNADEDEEYDHDDDVSKLSEAMSSVACSSVATVRQERDMSIRNRASSEVTISTSSSGFTNIKKQVFRVSDASRSLTSNGESTTLSAIIQKENESYLPFRAGTFSTIKLAEGQRFVAPSALQLSPIQQTPMQAMKWRSLAVAAQEKDALKASGSIKKQTRGLSLRSINT